MMTLEIFQTRVFDHTLSKYGDRAQDPCSITGKLIVAASRRFSNLSFYYFKLYLSGRLDKYFRSSSSPSSLVLWYHEEVRELASNLTKDESNDIKWIVNRLKIENGISLPPPRCDVPISYPILSDYRWYFKQFIRRRPMYINQFNYLKNTPHEQRP